VVANFNVFPGQNNAIPHAQYNMYCCTYSKRPPPVRKSEKNDFTARVFFSPVGGRDLGKRVQHKCTTGGGGLISLWLYKENNKLRDWKMYLLYIFPLSSTHLWFRCSNFFNPSKKNSFGCAANRKSQRLISTLTYHLVLSDQLRCVSYTDSEIANSVWG
jgi:hypothetical protein